jgi:hypothetical protein
VVIALCRAMLKEMNGETVQRRFIKMLGKNYLEPSRDIPLLRELIGELAPAQSAVAGR